MKKPQLYSLFLLFFSSYLLFSCENKEAKIYALNYPDKEWHWAAIQAQLTKIGASAPTCCYEKALQLPNAKEIVKFSFGRYIYDSTYIKKYTIALPLYKTNIYSNYIGTQRYKDCQNGFLIKTIAFEDKHYLWFNIDAGDRIFWTNSDVAAKDTQQILFDYKYFSWDLNTVKTPFENEISKDTDFTKQFDLAPEMSINSQFYIEARNNKGYIFDISKAGQISELNRFLHDNTAFHKIENKHKIDSFLMLLHEAHGINMYHKFSFTDFSKKEVDTIKLKIKGFDYANLAIYYFDSIASVPYTEDFIHKRIYSNFVYSVDNLSIMREYLSTNSPTFLYYKHKGNYELPWQNYFLAYHLTYVDDGCPTIIKVDMIVPKRMYLYVCYPMGFCNDVGPSPYHLVRGKKESSPQKINDDYTPSK